MDLYAGVFLRLEFPSSEHVTHWLATDISPDDLAPQDAEDDLYGYVEDGANDGELDEFPETIDAALAFLRGQPGWTVTVTGTRVELVQDGAAAEDMYLVQAGLANGLYFHATERAGADGYYYVVQAMHADGGADVDAAWLCHEGASYTQVPGDDYDDQAAFRDEFAARMTAADGLWSVADERADGPWADAD